MSKIWTASSVVSVKHCSLCSGTTEYYCHSCLYDLCRQCKETHVVCLDTKHHDVTIYRGKLNHLHQHETCKKHPDRVYKMYCKDCAIPVCNTCKKHRNHRLQTVQKVYKNKRKQNKNIIIKTRSETIYKFAALLDKTKYDFTVCHEKIEKQKSASEAKSQKLIDSILRVQNKIILAQTTYIAGIQEYEHIHEQSSNRPIQFLRFIQTVCLPEKHCLFSGTQDNNKEELVTFLCNIERIENGKRQIPGNEHLLTLMPTPMLQKDLEVKDVNCLEYISCVTPDRVWISGDGKKNSG